MLDPFNTEEGPGRAYIDINAELDTFEFEEEVELDAEDFNFALGRPTEMDFADE
ncbi:MAG: hypothetical protein GKS03_15185 [Alphaproteobacteria bacterium]|nr:hypothetical protein [Alphaproteobacteria bacterium]